MKLIINDPDLRHPLKITLPTGFLRSSLVWNMLVKYADADSQASLQNCQYLVKDCLAELLRYKRRYGSFNLVEVESADGSRVIITI